MQRRKSFFNNEMEQRFSLRKYTIGLCSVCLGFVTIGMGSQSVKADTVNNVEKSSVVQENKMQDADSATAKPNITPTETKKNEVGSVATTAPKTNTTSNGVKANTADSAISTETKPTKANSTLANSNIVSAQAKSAKAELAVQPKVGATSTEIKPQETKLAKTADTNNTAVVNTSDQSKSEDSSAVAPTSEKTQLQTSQDSSIKAKENSLNNKSNAMKAVAKFINLNEKSNSSDPNSKDAEVKPKESSNLDTNEQKEKDVDVAKPTRETVGSQWRIHYIDSTNHEHELKAPTVITMQYTRINTPQSDGTIQHGDWSYVPGSFKLTGTPITVNDSNNPVKQDNVDNNGKNEDVFTITAMYPTITGYNFHDGINNLRLHDHLLNYDPNGNIQRPTMGQDFDVEYDPIGERSIAVKFVDDQSYDFNTSDHKKQVGQAMTLTGRDGDTVNLKLTVPDKYQLADGQQLPTTYTFAKGSGDLKIHLVHKVVQREATIDAQLLLITLVRTRGDDSEDAVQYVVTQTRWKQLGDDAEHLNDFLGASPVVGVGTLTGHVDYDLVDETVVSLKNDWTSLNLSGHSYELPNGTEVVNGIRIDASDTVGKKLRDDWYLNEYRKWHHDVDPDYITRPWYGYLSVNETNNERNSDYGIMSDVRELGLQAGLVGDEPNALAKAIGDRAATSVEMSNKPIDLNYLNLLQGYNFDFSEQDGQLRAKAPLLVAGVYIPYVEKTATRTINVTTPDGKTTAVKQTATLAKQVDFGKDAHPAWTTGEWASYDAPAIPGYTASQSNVAKEAVTGTTKDQTVNITYTANDGTQTIVYQDEDGSEIDKQVISGKTDEKIKVTSDVPDGYVLKGEVPSEVTIKPDDTPITVTVEHGKSHVTPDKPVNKGDLIPDTKDKHYPEGLTHDDLNKTVTREITITDPIGKKTTTTQTVTFTRGATVDEVTDKVTYDDWSENGKHTFDKVDVPYITGYRASEEVPEVTVTPDSKSNTVDVTYAAKTYDVYIFYDYVATSYDRDNIDSSDGGGGIFYRKDFDKYANGEVGIAKPEVLHGHYGELINIPIKQVKGYYLDPYRDYSNYKFGMDAITGQELNWYNFFNAKDLKDPLPEDASDFDKEYSMPRFIFVDYVRDYAHSGYNNSGYNIGYVDTEGAVIGRPTNLRGISGTDTNFTAPTFEGYTLTNPQDVPTKFGKTSKDIFLVYKPQDVKVTYHYVDETGKQLVPSYVENNHFTGLTHVDQKDAKTIPGYSLVSTPEQTVVDGLKDLDLYFTYKANDGSQTISYQDNGQEVGKQVITGKTDQTVKVTPEVPDGYVVKSEIPKEVTIEAKDETIVIAVEHGKAHISPDKPVNKGDLIEGTKDKHYPEGLTHNDLNKTITREVTITDPTSKKSTTTQTVTFTRGATVDEVTNKVTYDDWSENGKHTFDKVEVPTVQGYTASGEVPSIVVTPETQSSKVDITYSANAQTATITYIDDTEKKTLGSDKQNGKFNQVITFEHDPAEVIKGLEEKGYKLVSNDFNSNKYQADNSNNVFYVHLKHGTSESSRKDDVNMTVHYVMDDGSKAPSDSKQTVSFTESGIKDNVTGNITWMPVASQTLKDVDSPVLTGYTADIKTANGKIVNFGDPDINVTVHYSANAQTATITYIDDTEKKTLGSDKQNGKFNQVITFEHDPAEVIKGLEEKGYKLVSDNFKPGVKYQNDNKSNSFEVHLVHTYEPVETSQTITETVHYIDANGKPVAPDHVATVVVKVTGTRDKVTDSITWNTPSTGHFDEVISPVVPNMTPDKKLIPSHDVQYGDSDITESVVYTPDEIPSEPEKPNDQGKPNSKTPEKPNKPCNSASKTSEKSNKSSKEVSKQFGTIAKTTIPEKLIDSRTVDNHVSAKSTAKQELPQTGATTNTGIWTGLVSMIAGLGLVGASKKRKKN